jgi:hypothetical protein
MLIIKRKSDGSIQYSFNDSVPNRIATKKAHTLNPKPYVRLDKLVSKWEVSRKSEIMFIIMKILDILDKLHVPHHNLQFNNEKLIHDAKVFIYNTSTK